MPVSALYCAPCEVGTILWDPSVCPAARCPRWTCVVMQMRPAASTQQHHFLIEPFDLWLILLISSTIFPTECFFLMLCTVCVCVHADFRASPPFFLLTAHRDNCRLEFKRASGGGGGGGEAKSPFLICGVEETGALLKVITLHKNSTDAHYTQAHRQMSSKCFMRQYSFISAL